MVSGALLILIAIANPAAAIVPVETLEQPRHSSTQPNNNSTTKPTSLQPQIDCDSRPCIALSFDDGPHQDTTAQVLTTLEQKGAKASFFLVGENIAGNETLVQRMAADGFEVGNHTWDHKDMTTVSPDQLQSDILMTQAAIVSAGAPAPQLFRPPYGAINSDVVSQVGLQIALWNEDPEDWRATDPNLLAQTVVAIAKPGGVIDLHDVHPVTAAALPQIIDQLQAKNYQFVTVSQLLHSRDRPGHEPFYGYSAASYAPHP